MIRSFVFTITLLFKFLSKKESRKNRKFVTDEFERIYLCRNFALEREYGGVLLDDPQVRGDVAPDDHTQRLSVENGCKASKVKRCKDFKQLHYTPSPLPQPLIVRLGV
ncbi:hypothetical protein ACX27_22500 [Nostoc piscinale CENA21]|uniref:Uncharacterized protein n=1 Tax=Nostoc piscinale CENA21 TaxID=224013 RepID=A0A0M3V682_9NOSO|nr:hypothetical protein ACX27_22500 [Nostoc piscinale CENA21]